VSRDLLASCFVLAAAIAGLLRGVSVHLYKERVYTLEIPTRRIDTRYQALLARLPPGGRFGYLTDAPPESEQAGRLRFDALYALAPRLLVSDPAARFVIADLLHPEALPRLCAARGLVVVAAFEGGTALLERR
jgi:hypothetical protein